jgi:hypothetical protein
MNSPGYNPIFNNETGLIMTGFFMFWNFLMAFVMVQNVFCPISNGICGA